MLRPDTFALTALLALLTALGPLAVDMYVPSFPEISQLLGAPAATVQLTLSLYMVSYAAGQVIYGPLSDRYGRKPVLRAALVIYCVGVDPAARSRRTSSSCSPRAPRRRSARRARWCSRVRSCATSIPGRAPEKSLP